LCHFHRPDTIHFSSGGSVVQPCYICGKDVIRASSGGPAICGSCCAAHGHEKPKSLFSWEDVEKSLDKLGAARLDKLLRIYSTT
jgi:hypothetical protein